MDSFINVLIEAWTYDPLNKNIMVNFDLSLHTTQQKSKDNFKAKSPLFYIGKWHTQRLNVATLHVNYLEKCYVLPTRNIEWYKQRLNVATLHVNYLEKCYLYWPRGT